MAYNGSTVVAKCIGEETLGIHAVPLTSFLQNNKNSLPFLKIFSRNLHFFMVKE